VRILPCPNCGIATLKDGSPYWLVHFPTVNVGVLNSGVFQYVCYRCVSTRDSKATRLELTPQDFYSLQPLSMEQLETHGLLEKFLRDYGMGGAITPAQARDLFQAGFFPEDLQELRRDLG
jgi:hypothetical protein